jgi:hypothetical protein
MAVSQHTSAVPMPSWLKTTMLAGLVFFICWGGAIYYWRTTRSAPGATDLALYLLGLPSLLALALCIGEKLAGQHAPAAAVPIALTASQPAAPAQTAPLAILATSLRAAHGATAEELLAAIAAGKARAGLDPELVDEDGFPVMSVRSPDARNDALQDRIMAWFRQNGMPGLQLGAEQWRALVLGSAVVAELAARAARLLPADDPAMLRLVPLLPAEWPEAQRHAAGIWFEHTAAQCGWPIEHITLAALDGIDLHAATPSAALGRLAHEAATTDVRVTALLVACASHIGADSVARWAADGALFTARHPQGAIPGEGAAGLLLADLPQARAVDGLRFSVLAPLQEARREAPAETLGAAAQRLLAGRSADADAIAQVVADTGHRSSRVLELMAFMAGTLPRLDAIEDVVRVGEACGSCAALPFVTALALASHRAQQGNLAVLCLGNEDPQRRHAALVQPA